MPLPQPPVKTMADFVVFCFVSIVVVVIVGALILIPIVAITTDRDLSSIIKALMSVISSMISALVGYLAGRGQMSSEIQQLHDAKSRSDLDERSESEVESE